MLVCMAVVLVTEFMLVVWINGRFGFLACSLPRLERAGLSLCLVPYPCGLSSAFVLGQSSGRVLSIVLGHGTMRVSSLRVGVLFSFVYAHVELHAHAFAIGYTYRYSGLCHMERSWLGTRTIWACVWRGCACDRDLR